MKRAPVFAALALCLTIAGCSSTDSSSSLPTLPSRVPFIGNTPDLEVHAVKSIKTVRVAKIAVMPLLENPDKSNGTVVEGSAETVTAELIGQVALAGGWELVPETDVTDALQKLPPLNLTNQQTVAIELGKSLNADVVIYGTVNRFKERVGIAYAAQSPASVEFTLHMVQVTSGQVVWTAKFDRTQKALFENFFNVVNFVKAEGRWVKAHEIAQDGVQEAVANLHDEVTLARTEMRFEGGSIEENKKAIQRAQQKEATQ
jgi:PBP1b-binding outer membrane lipoprotein LpoB